MVTAEISLEDALPGKMQTNVLGHYTRWDVLSLNFNRERLSPFKNIPSPAINAADLSSELGEAKEKIRGIGEKLDRLVEKLEG